MRSYVTVLSYVMASVSSVALWRCYVVRLGLVSVRHFTPTDVALIYTTAVVGSVVFMLIASYLYRTRNDA